MAKWLDRKRGEVKIGSILGGGAHGAKWFQMFVVNSGPKSSFPDARGWNIKRRGGLNWINPWWGAPAH